MAWFNADDKMHSHPKVRQAGLEAIGLWLVSGTYSTDYLTDGAIPEWFVLSWPKGKGLATKLVQANLWEVTPEGWQFCSWTEYQRTKTQVIEEKRKAAERKERFKGKSKEQ